LTFQRQPHYMHSMQFFLTHPQFPSLHPISSFEKKILPARVTESLNSFEVTFSLT
jgi:hypothetical protein